VPQKYTYSHHNVVKRRIKVFVKLKNAKTVFLDVESNMTVRAFKQKIQELEGIPINEQRLVFAGRDLDTERKLSDYSIRDKSLITMGDAISGGPMKVYIKSAAGKTTTLDVDPAESIRSLKIKIQAKEKIPPGQQVLMFGGQTLSDLKTVGDYRIPKYGVISLSNDDGQKSTRTNTGIMRQFGGRKGEVNVKTVAIQPKSARSRALTGLGHKNKGDNGMPLNIRLANGETITLDVDPTDPILWVKESIEGYMGVDGIPAAEQRLVFQGKAIEDTRTLSDYQVPPDGTLHLNPVKMAIDVKTPKGKTVTLEVESSDTIHDVKKLLGFWEGTPYWMQRLQKSGKGFMGRRNSTGAGTLPDDETLSDLNIGAGGTIDLVAGHPLYVKTPKGKLVRLDASGEDTVASLKSRIQFWEGIPSGQQRLMFNGKALDNNRTLKEYNIPKGAVIHLNPDKLGLYIRKPDGNTVLVEADPSDMVSAFKKKLQRLSGVDPTAQNLLFGGSNLDDNTTMGEYDIPENSVVYLNPQAVKVKVTLPSGKVSELDVLPSDTVFTMKKKLNKLEGIPLDMQRLEMPSEPNMGPLLNTRTMGEYPMGTDPQFKVSEATPLYITKADGSNVVVDFDPTEETVAVLKQKIAQLTGMPIEQQRLVFQGKPLNDDRVKVSRYKVPKNGTVELNPNSMPVQVHTADGKTITLQMDPLATMRNVKDLMSFWNGIPPEEQRINLTGKKWKRPMWDKGTGLGDDRTLRSVGIGKNGDLDLTDADPLTVILPDGKKVVLDVTPSNTLGEIKQKLLPFVGIDPKAQNLVGIGGKPLKDAQTLAQSDIPIGGTVYLNPVQGTLKVQDGAGNDIEVPVFAYDSVGELKKRLSPLVGLPVEGQNLFHNGDEFGQPEFDLMPLSKFDVKPATGNSAGSTVYLNPVMPGKMRVKTPDGKEISVDTTPMDTVSQFKKKLAKLTGLPVEQYDDQTVNYNGTPMHDGLKTLGEYGVKPNDTGNLEMVDPFGVNVRLPNGKTVVIQTDPNAPLDQLKERLAKISGIPGATQSLFSDDVDPKTPLDGTKSLAQYELPKGSTLELNPGEYPINVSLPNGRTVPVYVSPSDTFDGLKGKLQNLEGIPKSKQPLVHSGKPQPDTMTMGDARVQPNDVVFMDPNQFPLLVRAPDGKTFKIQVSPADNISLIREKIGKVRGIPPEEQRVIYDSTPLGDDPRATLADYGVQPGATMDLATTTPIRVRTPEGQVHVLDMDPADTIGSLKERVQTFDGRVPENPDEELRMLYNGAPLDDLHPISDYNIPKSGVIDMVKGQTVFVRTPDGKTHTLDVEPFDTIMDLKRQLQNIEGIPADYQRLMLNKEPLSDNAQTLKAANVKPNSTLDLEDANPVYVTTPSGQTITLDCDPNMPISELKDRLQDLEGIPAQQQKIFFAGKPLANVRSLQDYRVPKGATLNMNPDTVEISVKKPNGKTVALNVDPNAPISEIKNQLQFWEGILPEDQRLAFKDEPLLDNESLNDRNIPPMGEISLEQAHPLFAKLPDGSTVVVDLEPSDDLNSVRKKIGLLSGVPPEDLRVLFEGHDLHDNELSDLPKGAQLVVDDPNNPILVSVQAKTPNGNVITVEVDPEDSVSSIKNKMNHWNGDNGGDGVSRLAFKGTPLEDDMTLADYSVPEDGLLDLDEPFMIYVQMPEEDGRLITLDVDEDEQVSSVKSMLESLEGIPSEEQRLVFDNIPLINDRTIQDYRVPRGGVLFLNPPGADLEDPYYIFVHLLTGKTVLLNTVDPMDMVDKVKTMTKTMESIPLEQDMILQFKGRVMDDDKTLLDHDVISGATLVEGLERIKPIQNLEVANPNDRYEAAFSQAQKAATAEKNGDIDYAAALYQNAGETLLRAAESEIEPSLRNPVKAKGDDLLERANMLKETGVSAPAQPRRMTIVQSADPETGLEGELVSSVTPRSKSIGAEGEMDPEMDDDLDPEMEGGTPVLDDLSPEAGMRYTPVNTTPKRFEDDGYALRAAGAPEKTWGKISSREIKAFALVTCYNEKGDFLRRTLSSYAKNIFMLQQVFGEKVWEEMPISVVLDGKAAASQSMLDYCQNELQLFSPEVMAISSLGLDVQMHLFERTIFMPKVDSIPMPPMHVILGLKEANKGKLDSHAWFFEAFCDPLQPKYVILIDVGTVLVEDAVFRVIRSMDRDPQVAAVHGEPTALSPNYCHLTVAAQHFEYKATNIMERSLGSMFGFIDLLPGCFVSYRFGAIKTKEHPTTGVPEGPLVNYFQPLTTSMDKLGPFLGNMHLSEGRVLCFEVVARWNEKWTMHYCKDAVARTDVPDSIPALIRQRKRWLNGSFFASIYTLLSFFRVVKDTRHNPLRKFFFFFEWLWIAIGLFTTWFFISNLYMIFYYVWSQGLLATDGSQKQAEDVLLLLSIIYLSVLIVQFLAALGNRPEDVHIMYCLSAFYFGCMIIFCLILQLVPLFDGDIWLLSNTCDERGDVEDGGNGEPPCEPCEEERGSIMWALMIVVGIYLVAALIHWDLPTVLLSVFQYFVMMPTFVNILSVYAFSNIQDLSWGSKGQINPSTGTLTQKKKGRGSIANFIEREKQAREEKKARSKQLKAVKSQFETFRSLVLCLWILSNFWWANLWFFEDPYGFCYLNYVAWFVCVIAVLKLVASIVYQLTDWCRYGGEKIGIFTNPYKYEAGKVDKPVVPKGKGVDSVIGRGADAVRKESVSL